MFTGLWSWKLLLKVWIGRWNPDKGLEQQMVSQRRRRAPRRCELHYTIASGKRPITRSGLGSDLVVFESNYAATFHATHSFLLPFLVHQDSFNSVVSLSLFQFWVAFTGYPSLNQPSLKILPLSYDGE